MVQERVSEVTEDEWHRTIRYEVAGPWYVRAAGRTLVDVLAPVVLLSIAGMLCGWVHGVTQPDLANRWMLLMNSAGLGVVAGVVYLKLIEAHTEWRQQTLTGAGLYRVQGTERLRAATVGDMPVKESPALSWRREIRGDTIECVVTVQPLLLHTSKELVLLQGGAINVVADDAEGELRQDDVVSFSNHIVGERVDFSKLPEWVKSSVQSTYRDNEPVRVLEGTTTAPLLIHITTRL